jgi:hypothetical protein
MLQRWVLYYHLTWLTSPPIWWDSIVWWYDHRMINTVSHKSMRESIEVEIVLVQSSRVLFVQS